MAKCRHCGSENVRDTSTYNDTAFSDNPSRRLDCDDCGKRTWISLKGDEKLQDDD